MDIKIQKATTEDFDEILNWRNDDLSRLMSRSQERVSIEEQHKWFDSYLTGNKITIYMGYWSEKKIGVCYFNFDEESKMSEVSININPNFRGLGLSRQFLMNALSAFRKINTSLIRAVVKKSNKPSISIFKTCDFTLIDEDTKYFYFNYK
ncbi:GNAT family N-acetyltransferase [Candidatus Methylopumilus universalis]|uniref:GNAT family N-acetyltransferase n=1 Tax=Candidatus Methylopumilus universalis TaxID=2588536 RepID=UPI00111E949C|nr:GNAT family protein [Candidatus Methylopumilus universalis]QDC47517.1 GNAT family N-acetyltransferase [Candidatus Methylopumilus universalis]QDC72050.1 GNAT family N-acetyltransferase [Candidatus Methylopumilus universalis]